MPPSARPHRWALPLLAAAAAALGSCAPYPETYSPSGGYSGVSAPSPAPYVATGASAPFLYGSWFGSRSRYCSYCGGYHRGSCPYGRYGSRYPYGYGSRYWRDRGDWDRDHDDRDRHSDRDRDSDRSSSGDSDNWREERRGRFATMPESKTTSGSPSRSKADSSTSSKSSSSQRSSSSSSKRTSEAAQRNPKLRTKDR